MAYSENQDLIHANQLMKEGKIKEAYHLILELEKRADSSPQELLSYKLFKANVLCKLRKFSDAIKYGEDIYQESQKQGDLLSLFDGLSIQAYANDYIGNLSLSEEIIEKAEDLLKVIKSDYKIDLRERESFFLRIKANHCSLEGKIQPSLEFNEKAFECAKNTDNKELISVSLNNISSNYIQLKEYDKALIYIKEAIKLNYIPFLTFYLANIIEIYVKKGNTKQAKVYFNKLRELKDKLGTKSSKDIYRFNKALILKMSLRARDRIKAEDIFRELSSDNTLPTELRIQIIMNLCDLFLIELRITNDPEIIDEIQPFIQKLLDIAEHQHSYVILAETYLLQTKLTLLIGDIKQAKRYLTQAQKISERFGYKELVEKITKEESKLLKQVDLWEKLKELGTPMEERIKLTNLNEHIEEILEKRTMIPAFINEERVAISKETKICLVCRGEVSKFTYICECGAIYCDNCARALTNLENVCWVCETPIDYSKPVKFYDEELEEIKLDSKGKKK